jgi:hypothetical protein
MLPFTQGLAVPQLYGSTSNFISNVPNMSANQVCYSLGYATEKVGEAFLLRGITRTVTFNANDGFGYMLSNGRNIGSYKLPKIELFYRTPSVQGGTIFAYKSPAGNAFRLDYHRIPAKIDGINYLSPNKYFHYHTNFGGRGGSAHRSLNPINFGAPIIYNPFQQ